MKIGELQKLGLPAGKAVDAAIRALRAAADRGLAGDALRAAVAGVIAAPREHVGDAVFGELARVLVERVEPVFREGDAPYRIWGQDLEKQSVQQIVNACRLPISVRGALMPDAHVGYGLPIGGVLATRDAVIPYAVGVDIACRMKMTVLDLPHALLDGDTTALERAIAAETRFGIGANFKSRRRIHDVLDDDWGVSPVTRRLKDKAWSQLGTSGSGNHFVEFGVLSIESDDGAATLGLEKGRHLALLSHSGSRGTGAEIAGHYSRVARDLHPELPRELGHLAWLDLASEAGQEYWAAMELMGKYAAANHACIHRHIARNLGVETLLDLENHHNFAWKEEHDGETLVVHRKGATPAGLGVLGIIPGSMASPTYIVRGKGSDASLRSAAHGAGRVMSRTRAKQELDWKEANRVLAANRVKLLSAGLDEVPMVYKDIHAVMREQQDLVEPVALFHPRLVKMAPAGERAED